LALMLFGGTPAPWFTQWLGQIQRGITAHDIGCFAEAFATEARYFLRPDQPPLEGVSAILRHIEAQFSGQREMHSEVEILGFTEASALVRWRARYTSVQTGLREAYDGLVIYRFTPERQCILRQSWAVQWADPLP